MKIHEIGLSSFSCCADHMLTCFDFFFFLKKRVKEERVILILDSSSRV